MSESGADILYKCREWIITHRGLKNVLILKMAMEEIVLYVKAVRHER